MDAKQPKGADHVSLGPFVVLLLSCLFLLDLDCFFPPSFLLSPCIGTVLENCHKQLRNLTLSQRSSHFTRERDVLDCRLIQYNAQSILLSIRVSKTVCHRIRSGSGWSCLLVVAQSLLAIKVLLTAWAQSPFSH